MDGMGYKNTFFKKMTRNLKKISTNFHIAPTFCQKKLLPKQNFPCRVCSLHSSPTIPLSGLTIQTPWSWSDSTPDWDKHPHRASRSSPLERSPLGTSRDRRSSKAKQMFTGKRSLLNMYPYVSKKASLKLTFDPFSHWIIELADLYIYMSYGQNLVHSEGTS